MKAKDLAVGIKIAGNIDDKVLENFDKIMGSKSNRHLIEFCNDNFGVGPLATYEILLGYEMEMREKQVVGSLLKAYYKGKYSFKDKATTYKINGKSKTMRSFIMI